MPLSIIVYFCLLFSTFLGLPILLLSNLLDRHVLLLSTLFHFTCIHVYFLRHHKKENKVDNVVHGYYDTTLLKGWTGERCPIEKIVLSTIMKTT